MVMFFTFLINFVLFSWLWAFRSPVKDGFKDIPGLEDMYNPTEEDGCWTWYSYWYSHELSLSTEEDT